MSAFKLFAAAAMIGAGTLIDQQARRDSNEYQRDSDASARNYWTSRQQAALISIEEGLSIDHSRQYVSDGSKRRLAAELRQETFSHCREQNNVLMSYTEKCIERFVRGGTR